MPFFLSRLRKSFFLGGLALLLGGCVDSFEPAIISTPQNYLVVGGFINLNGITTIKLSRTVGLSTTAPAPAETHATVAIQDDAGTSYLLSEPTPGTYTSTSLTLSTSHRYQLHLRTATGRDYDSDLVVAKLTPPIDQVSWAVASNGVRILVGAHDLTSNTRYYRWKYEETWEFHSNYFSHFEYVNGVMRPRTEDIYHCWSSANSSTILLNSTEKLSQDVVDAFPLFTLPANSFKLRFKYSVLVQQYAQTAEEYAYWEKLKKNTETLGSLFDPLPTQLTGNVHCRQDATEPVIGYIGATSVAQQRIFIDPANLPPTNFQSSETPCDAPAIVSLADVSIIFSGGGILPLDPVYSPVTLALTGYTGASITCVDCRLKGTNQKPAYWP